MNWSCPLFRELRNPGEHERSLCRLATTHKSSLERHPLQRRESVHPEVTHTCENEIWRMSDRDLVTAFFGISEAVMIVQLASKERERNPSWIAAAILINSSCGNCLSTLQ